MDNVEIKKLLGIKEEIAALEKEYEKYSMDEIIDYMFSYDLLNCKEGNSNLYEAIKIIKRLLHLLEKNNVSKNVEIMDAIDFVEQFEE